MTTQLKFEAKICADDKASLVQVLKYILEEVEGSSHGEIDLDSDDPNSSLTASSYEEDVEDEE